MKCLSLISIMFTPCPLSLPSFPFCSPSCPLSLPCPLIGRWCLAVITVCSRNTEGPPFTYYPWFASRIALTEQWHKRLQGLVSDPFIGFQHRFVQNMGQVHWGKYELGTLPWPSEDRGRRLLFRLVMHSGNRSLEKWPPLPCSTWTGNDHFVLW